MSRTFRERNAKKQTRLAFQTLPSTSEVKEGYSQAVQDRLSSVRYEGSTPRRTRSTASVDSALPTPEPSSQPSSQRGTLSSDEDDIVLPSSKRRRTEPSDAPTETPTRRSGRLAASSQPSRTAVTSPLRDGLEILGSPETSGDDEPVIVSKATQKARRARNSPALEDPFIDDAPQRSKGADDFVVDDDEVEYVSDDEPMPVRRRKKNRLRSRHEQDELDEDLEDLRTSDVEEERSRTRGRVVNKQRDKAREHLELLKRRRAGEKIPRVLDSEDDDEFREEDGADLDEIQYTQGRTGHSVASSDTGHNEDALQPADEGNEDDFIVEDEDDDDFGGLTNGIPLKFTSFATRKPKELFRYIVEWLVMNKIAPAFKRDSEVYEFSWQRVNDQMRAQAGSRLISSAWNEDFKYTILARPEIQITHDAGLLNCSACNKTGHPASYKFKLGGHAYNPDTLEPLKEEEDSDEDEDEADEGDDTASYDKAGHLIASTSAIFHLGSTCANNAELGHKLTHWKWHLNQSLLEYLDDQGVLSPEMIVAREQKSSRKREKEAQHIVNAMDETGVIDEMWRELQSDLDDARIGMEDHQSKGRGKARIGKVRAAKKDGRIEEYSAGGAKRIMIVSDSEGD